MYSKNFPDHIQKLVPYVPGKPIEETKREFGLKSVVKLASNENPLGSSPKAIKAIKKGLSELHRYPDASAFALKSALAKFLGRKREELLIGNGSNDVIDLIIRCFCKPGEAIITTDAAFVAYEVCAQVQGVRTLKARLDENLVPDSDAIVKLVRDNPDAKLVFLANPNNPTGTYLPNSDLLKLVKRIKEAREGMIVVLDYAYWEYVTAQDLTPPEKLYPAFDHVVLLRTFSKIYGLAGLRIGYAVGHPSIFAMIERARQPFNSNSLALIAAEAALQDRAFVKKAFSLNVRERKAWEKKLEGWKVPFYPSQGNFLLVNAKIGFGMSGVELFNHCLREGVILRPVANYGLHDLLRISIGTRSENEKAWKAFDRLKRKSK